MELDYLVLNPLHPDFNKTEFIPRDVKIEYSEYIDYIGMSKEYYNTLPEYYKRYLNRKNLHGSFYR